MRFRFLTTVTAISLFTLFSANPAQSQLRFSQDFDYSWDFTGGGARAAAMGNAFTAIAEGPYALSWNPSGLVGLDEIYFSFDWMNYIPSGSYDFNSVQTFDHSGSSSNFFRNMALISPMKVKKQEFVLGFGVTRHFDTYDVFAEKIFPHVSSPGTTDLVTTRDGALSSANLGFSTSISERFSMGVTANIYFGRVIIDEFRTETYESQAFSDGQFVDYSRSLRQLDSLNLSGFNFNIGAMYDLGENTTLGLNIRTPFDIKISDDVTLDRIITNNTAVVSTGIFSSDTLLFPDVETKIQMPLMLTFGLAHNWSENFLSSVDFEYRGFSSSDFLLLDSVRISQGGTRETFFHNEPTNWNNVLQIRVGGEYTVDSKLGEIPLRAGFGYLPQPFSDIDDYIFTYNGFFAPVLPLSLQATNEPRYAGANLAFAGNEAVNLFEISGSQINAINLSFGFGLHSPQRALDIAYSFTSYTQSRNTSVAIELGRNDDLTPTEYDPRLTSDASPYLVNVSRSSTSSVRDHRIMVSFTGFF